MESFALGERARWARAEKVPKMYRVESLPLGEVCPCGKLSPRGIRMCPYGKLSPGNKQGVFVREKFPWGN